LNLHVSLPKIPYLVFLAPNIIKGFKCVAKHAKIPID